MSTMLLIWLSRPLVRWCSLVLLFGTLACGSGWYGYAKGVAYERGRTAQQLLAGAERQRLLTAALQRTVDAAASARAARDQAYARTRLPLFREVTRYVQSPAAHHACPDADGVRIGAAAIAAANLALATR